jgi:A/G-specific adenine glycosylase
MNFSKLILIWYYDNKEDFPWRQTKDPYKIWLSEIMLQQTQVKTVIPFYLNWIKNFPTIFDVANASDEKLFKHWEGLGYYNRVNNFRIACNDVINKYKGKIPQTKTELLDLKGIGDYTSSAIASIAFNKINYVIDGNVKRIMSRVLRLKDFSKFSFKKIDNFLSNNIDSNNPGDFNQALMDLGRYICKPKNPTCDFCPISSCCSAYLNNQVLNFPIINKIKKKLPHYTIGVGVIWHNNKILITKRKKNALLGGLWEFPGGKVMNDESIKNCIKREIFEELSINVFVSEFITKVKHKYSHFGITLYAHHCIYEKGDIVCNAADDWKWVTPFELNEYPFPKANHYIFPHIINSEVV